MRRASWVLAMGLLAACGGPGAEAPRAGGAGLPGLYAAAMKLDATGDPRAAVRAHEDVVRAAVEADGDPWQVQALEASLDALATRSLSTLAEVSADASLARRTTEPVTAALEALEPRARGPFARGLVARAITALREREGDAARSADARVASGCATEAVVIGPTSWAPVTAVSDEGPLDRPGARLEASYATGSPFGARATPIVVRGRGCALDLVAESGRVGVRDVVVDLHVDRAQTIGLGLRAHGAAVLRAGGLTVARRGFDLGDGEAPRFARVKVSAGTLRLVARVGTAKDSDSVEIDAWGEDGRPLPAAAPAVGSVTDGRALGATAPPVEPRGPDELLLASAADVASGDPREAEERLWGIATKADAPPRSPSSTAGRSTPPATSPPRRAPSGARSAYERVLEVWPASWEAAAAHASLAGVRKGRDAAGVETLRDLDGLKEKMGGAWPPLLDVLDAVTSGRERLFDRGRAALEPRPAVRSPARRSSPTPRRPRRSRGATSPLESAPRPGARAATRSCASMRCGRPGITPLPSRSSARVRGVLGAPARWLSVELRDALAAGDDAAASKAFGAMLPAERTLSAWPHSTPRPTSGPTSSARPPGPRLSPGARAAPPCGRGRSDAGARGDLRAPRRRGSRDAHPADRRDRRPRAHRAL